MTMSKAPLFILALLFSACDDGEDTPPPVAEPPGSIDVDAPVLDFGTLGVGETESHPFTLSNLGQGTLEVWDVTFVDDTARAHWSLDGTLTGPIEPGESSTVSVEFAPHAVGDLPAQIVIRSDDPDEPERFVTLEGACFGTPMIGLSSTTLDFGQVEIGSWLEEDLWISNWGTDDLTLTSVFLGNPEDPTFTLLVDPSGVVLAPGAENGLAVIRFTPVYNGPWYGSLFIASNDPATPEVPVTLVGSGQVP